MTEQTCTSCGRAVHQGTTLCARCVKTLDHALVNVAAHYDDLDTLRTKRTRYATGGTTRGSIGKTRPIGVDLRFVTPSDVDGDREGQGTALVDDVRTTITHWTKRALATWPDLTPPADHLPACCHFLGGYLTAIAGQPWANDLLEDVLRLEVLLARMVDRPADRWYAGKCWVPDHNGVDCQQELYATEDSGTITCPTCGVQHDVAERREVLLTEAREVHVTATEAAGALIAWTDYDGSEAKLVDLIRRWRDRDKLEVQDVTSLLGKDRHLYRLGDIQELLVQHAQRAQTRRLESA
jgi:uncharacterized Zn finger protein (UPF0148 family)